MGTAFLVGWVSVLLFCTVYSGSVPSNDDISDPDYNIQNDDNYGTYDDSDDALEESKMPNSPLKITTEGQKFVRNLGETVVLPCKISGSHYVLVWRKKDSQNQDAVLFQSEIRMAATKNMKLLDNGSLEISNLHVQDAAEYGCTAMDTKLNSPTIQHHVIVRLPPRIELLTAKNNQTLLKNGETLTLICKASGYPKPVISWHKGSLRFESRDEVLKIENVKHHNAGTYKCLADNKIGEPAFDYINIKVEYKPLITIEKITVSAENNTQTELECLVHAEPTAQVVWKKDGQILVNTDRVRVATVEHNKHGLVLKNVANTDFGKYTCTASNSLGATSKDIRLVATPAIHKFTKSHSGGRTALAWEVQSKSPLLTHDVLYRRSNKENEWIQVQEKPEVSTLRNDIYEVKYTLSRGLDPGDYDVKFRAENRNGWSEEEIDSITIEAFTKHGHNKPHKKGHKHGQEKHILTSTVPPPPNAPAEHQEDVVKESSSTASGSSDCSSTAGSAAAVFGVVFYSIYFHLKLPSWTM